MRPLWTLPLCMAMACSSSSTSPDAGGGGADASPSAGATKVIGAAGGSVAFGPVSLTVPSGAVAADTTFKISETTRAVRLPTGTRAISKVYHLEPDTSFAQPIRVSFDVDRSKVPARTGPLEGLLLLRAPTGTDDFEPIGAADLEATTIEGETLHFSDLLTALIEEANCTAPLDRDCNLSCAGLSCTGACTLRSAGQEYSASCAANLGTNLVECSCSSTQPGAMPVRSGPLSLSRVLGGQEALAAHTFLNRCGWPCGAAPQPDGGVAPDAAPLPDAEPGMDAAPPRPDAGPGVVEELPGNHFYTEHMVVVGDELFLQDRGAAVRLNLLTMATQNYFGWQWSPMAVPGVAAMGVDANTLYLSVYDEISGESRLTQTPLAGGLAREIAPNSYYIGQSADDIFYLTERPGIFKLSKAGGSAVNICTNPPPNAGAAIVHNNNLYFLSGDSTIGQIMRVPLMGGDCNNPIATSGGGPRYMLIDEAANKIYWANNPIGEIQIVDIPTGRVDLWTGDVYAVRQLAQDADYVYFSRLVRQGLHEIMRKGKRGNPLPEVLTAFETPGRSPEVRALAVHGDHLYWAASDSPGALYRIRK